MVPAHFGLARPIEVTNAIEHGNLPLVRLRELSPTVFEAAAAGDAQARVILDRLADELATMAVAMIRRLNLTRHDVAVTLAGGVFRAADPVFETRIAAGVLAAAPRARVRRLGAHPVLGAALLGLDQLHRVGGLTEAERDAATERLRREFRSGSIERD
jgi:N-acetylglucosamine kinase-like BadF-type ATPase